MKREPAFTKESDLCAAFIAALPKDWTAYPETGGFDIVLVRADGFQIGVEAKLRLNTKVILQAAESTRHYYVDSEGPDCRAVLVPDARNSELAAICRLLSVTVVTYRPPEHGIIRAAIHPQLPTLGEYYRADHWYELAPAKRLTLPDWVPDVSAGASAPQQLSFWKIAAIKIVVTLAKRGYVTRKDFAHHRISMSRWTQMRWIVQDGQGGWKANDLPDFRAQHPVNFPQIEADYEKWKSPEVARLAKQEALL